MASIVAREILDSRGNPTVACRVTLKNGLIAEAGVPSGASTGSHEDLELRDGGKRYGGLGVQKAVSHVNKILGPALIGWDVTKQREIDGAMLEMDGTENESKYGANAILSISLACVHASALFRRLPLWLSLRETFEFPRQPRLPIPTMNLLNGGAHADWAMDVQECMIVPKQKTMAERIRAGSETFHALKKLLKEKGLVTSVGDEGGFAPHFSHTEAAFEILIDAIKVAGYKPGKEIALATDVAATEWFNKKDGVYHPPVEKKKYDASHLLARYESWCMMYPMESIEDPFAEDDWEAWKKGMKHLGKKTTIVGDDFFVTNVKRLKRGIEEKAASAILIKFNQSGTFTEAVDAIIMAHEHKFATSISHRSGETADTTIADLAVACGSDYIKTGSLSRSERVEKYNRLLAIEQEMKVGLK
ncbi:MAG: phosphopyruvate hydratase [bacterium]|nr:phosphopyruvate hydratase [bacterium]